MFFIRKKIWLPTAIQRLFVFFLSFQLMTFAFFVLGNFQDFLEQTLHFLLQIQKISGIIFLLFGIYALISQFAAWYFEKKIRFARFLLILIGFIAGLIPVGIVYFFLLWTYPV